MFNVQIRTAEQGAAAGSRWLRALPLRRYFDKSSWALSSRPGGPGPNFSPGRKARVETLIPPQDQAPKARCSTGPGNAEFPAKQEIWQRRGLRIGIRVRVASPLHLSHRQPRLTFNPRHSAHRSPLRGASAVLGTPVERCEFDGDLIPFWRASSVDPMTACVVRKDYLV
jgi:hypothetical protein